MNKRTKDRLVLRLAVWAQYSLVLLKLTTFLTILLIFGYIFIASKYGAPRSLSAALQWTVYPMIGYGILFSIQEMFASFTIEDDIYTGKDTKKVNGEDTRTLFVGIFLLLVIFSSIVYGIAFSNVSDTILLSVLMISGYTLTSTVAFGCEDTLEGRYRFSDDFTGFKRPDDDPSGSAENIGVEQKETGMINYN